MRNSGTWCLPTRAVPCRLRSQGVAAVVVALSPRAFHKALDMPYSRCDTVESL
jgi:hypothetical protein